MENGKISKYILIILFCVIAVLILLIFAVSRMGAPGQDNAGDGSSGVVYVPHEVVPESTEPAAGDASERFPVSGQESTGSGPYTVSVQVDVPLPEDDLVVKRGDLIISHTEWVRSDADEDAICNAVEAYTKSTGYTFTEAMIEDFDEERLIYTLLLFPGDVELNVHVQ